MLVLPDLPFGFVAPDLLVERVEELLAGGGAGEGGAVVQRSAEPAEIEVPFRRPVELHAHPIQEVDQIRRGIAHRLAQRLIGEEVAAFDGVDEVDLGGVVFSPDVDGAVDPPLGADGMGAPHRHHGE
jgi:hypothetical protein